MAGLRTRPAAIAVMVCEVGSAKEATAKIGPHTTIAAGRVECGARTIFDEIRWNRAKGNRRNKVGKSYCHNTRARLKTLYGDAVVHETRFGDSGGFTATVRLPFREDVSGNEENLYPRS